MNNKNKLPYKKILVLGLGKSGISTVRTLHKMGMTIIVNDGKKRSDCTYASELDTLNILSHYGGHPVDLLDTGIDLIIKSPGIPYTLPLLQEAVLRGFSIVTEVEIASLLTNAHIIGITGSNGKTTTTSLVGDIFEAANITAEVCGNIGTALLDVATNSATDWLIAELSSFQLKGTNTFKPKIATLLNFSETHLDFHGNATDYLQSKLAIFANQDVDDFAVLNADNPMFTSIGETLRASLYWFSLTQEVSRGTFIKNEAIYFKDTEVETKIMELSAIPLKGSHNIENVLAATLIAILGGVQLTHIQTAIEQFQAVEHRLEFVGNKRGVAYYNDSKSTNPVSTVKACNAFDEPIILLLGGKDRGSKFTELADIWSRGNIKEIICYGETAELLNEIATFHGIPSRVCKTLDECVNLSSQVASNGDVVIFSPACASWDMYTSYEARGIHFKKAFNAIN